MDWKKIEIDAQARMWHCRIFSGGNGIFGRAGSIEASGLQTKKLILSGGGSHYRDG
ncbi:MAG: hypothetical protein ACLURV_00995 [Gallintestinimicrobium sp.]